MAETPVVLVRSHLLKATDISIISEVNYMYLRTVLKFYRTLVFKQITCSNKKIE